MGFRVDFFNYFRAVNGSPPLKITVYNKPVFQKSSSFLFPRAKSSTSLPFFKKLMAKAASENSCTENKDFHFVQTLLSQLIR